MQSAERSQTSERVLPAVSNIDDNSTMEQHQQSTSTTQMPKLAKTANSFMPKGNKKSSQEDPEKLLHINTAIQKKYNNLMKTSKSRFLGVQKYLNGAFISKQLPIPSFQGQKSEKQKPTDQRSALLNDDDLARNNSSDLLMEYVGTAHGQGRSATNLRKTNVEMSQLLKHEINFSKETVERVKRGHSIFDLQIVQEAQTNKQNVVIKKKGMSEQLDHFLDLSVADTTFVPQANERDTQNVINLIQNSPQKRLQRVMKARIVHNLKKRNGSEVAPNTSLQQQDKKMNSLVTRPFGGNHQNQTQKYQSMLPPAQQKLPLKNDSLNYGGQRRQQSYLDRSAMRQRKNSVESNDSYGPQKSMLSSTEIGTAQRLNDSNFSIPFGHNTITKDDTYRRQSSYFSNQNRSGANEQNTFYDYYYGNSVQPAVNNSITNLAIVRAATQIRDTLSNASIQMRNKLAPKGNNTGSAIRGGSIRIGANRSSTELNNSRFHGLRPAGGVSTTMKLSKPLGQQNSDQYKQSLTQQSPTNVGRRGRQNSIDDVQIDSSDVEEEKLPPFLGNVETSLKREYNQFQRMFEIPINPAFFKSTNIRQPKKLQSLQSYLKDQGIASTLPQHQIDQRERSKIEYKFWKQGIDAVIPGYNDDDLTSKIVQFIFSINFSKLNENEREMLFSEPLKRDPITRQVQEFMESFVKDWQEFLQNQSQSYMQRLAEVYRLRMGPQKYEELLTSGKLPTDLMRNENFHEHKQSLRKCEIHGAKPSEDEIQSCLSCHIMTKRLIPPKLDKRAIARQNQNSDQDPYSNTGGQRTVGGKAKSREFSVDDKFKEKMKEEEAQKSLLKLEKEVQRMPIFNLSNPPPETEKEKDVQNVPNEQNDDLETPEENKQNQQQLTASFKSNKNLEHQQPSPQKNASKEKIEPALTEASQINGENILKLREEGDSNDVHSKEINELVIKVEALCKERKMIEMENHMTAKQFGQLFEEGPQDIKRREEFEEAFKTNVALIFQIKGRKMLVDRYNLWIKKLALDLDSLDKQVRTITAGDLRIAKKLDGKIKFKAKRNPDELAKFGKHDEDLDSDNEEEQEKKLLFKKCFNKKNIALGRMINTQEKLQTKTKRYKSDLEKLLLRAKLDRPSMIQEKFRIIWKEQDGAAISAAAEATHEKNSMLLKQSMQLDDDQQSRGSSMQRTTNNNSFEKLQMGNSMPGGNNELSLPPAIRDAGRRTTTKFPTNLNGSQGKLESMSTMHGSQSNATMGFNKTTTGGQGFQQQKGQKAYSEIRNKNSKNDYGSGEKDKRGGLKSSFNRNHVQQQQSISFTNKKHQNIPTIGKAQQVTFGDAAKSSVELVSQRVNQHGGGNHYKSQASGISASVYQSSENNNAEVARDRKSVNSRESRVKLMSIRDVLHDRQAKRLKDNGLQKDGYKFMLQYMAKRRRQNPTLDIQREEVKIMNGVKLLVESGWVVDESYFKHLTEISGIGTILDKYNSAISMKVKIDPKVFSILSFANKFAENLGMPHYFGLEKPIALPREQNELFFVLDLSLYPDTQKKEMENKAAQETQAQLLESLKQNVNQCSDDEEEMFNRQQR